MQSSKKGLISQNNKSIREEYGGTEAFAHIWEYYLNGAFGEELVHYKGFQTNKNTTEDAGSRRLFLSVHRFHATGELFVKPDGTKELTVSDNIGSVRLVMQQDGYTRKHFDYKPFGDTLWTSDGGVNREGFGIFDSESSLLMMGARMYDNETGRFTTCDPLWAAFPAQSPYSYAYNSPLTWRDPSGLAPEKEKDREKLMSALPNDEELLNKVWDEMNSSQSTVDADEEEDEDENGSNSGGSSSGNARTGGGGGIPGYSSADRALGNWAFSDSWKTLSGEGSNTSLTGGKASGSGVPGGGSGNRELLDKFKVDINTMFSNAKRIRKEHGGIFYMNLSGEIKFRTITGKNEKSMGDKLFILAMTIMAEGCIGGRNIIIGDIHTHQVSGGPFSFDDMFSISGFSGYPPPTGYQSYFDNGDFSFVVGENGIYGFEITDADGFRDNFTTEFGYPSGNSEKTVKIKMPNFNSSKRNVNVLNKVFGNYGKTFYLPRKK